MSWFWQFIHWMSTFALKCWDKILNLVEWYLFGADDETESASLSHAESTTPITLTYDHTRCKFESATRENVRIKQAYRHADDLEVINANTDFHRRIIDRLELDIKRTRRAQSRQFTIEAEQDILVLEKLCTEIARLPSPASISYQSINQHYDFVKNHLKTVMDESVTPISETSRAKALRYVTSCYLELDTLIRSLRYGITQKGERGFDMDVVEVDYEHLQAMRDAFATAPSDSTDDESCTISEHAAHEHAHS